jgi:hypothetical protein
MPQLLTHIIAQQRINDYGSFNDTINLTLIISRQPKMMSIELRMNVQKETTLSVYSFSIQYSLF